MEAIIDLDLFKYHVASKGEKKSIIVKHKETGWKKEFKTRTEFYGHWKKKEGGWLANLNAKRDVKVLPEAFEIEDIQTPEPIENVLYTAKQMVNNALETCGAKTYKAFLGKGKSFRVERSTLLEYKGQRSKSLTPIYLQEVSDYLAHKFKAEIVTDIECDDACVIAAYKKPNRFILKEDKDFWGQPTNVFNINSPERGIVDCDKFGKLWRDNQGKVRGEGRIHFYWQVAGQDDSDNYKAHCCSDVYWGEVQAYEWLKDCKDDFEAMLKLKEVFLHLYPEPKIVTGWRGDDIEIDWRYVFNECFDMARMLRTRNEVIVGTEVMERLGVKLC